MEVMLLLNRGMPAVSNMARNASLLGMGSIKAGSVVARNTASVAVRAVVGVVLVGVIGW